jgi:DNA-binding NarL/FixJ family response regulator
MVQASPVQNFRILIDERTSCKRPFHPHLATGGSLAPSPPQLEGAGHPVRVLIVDDHRLFAEALALLLAGNNQIDVIGSAQSGEEAIENWADQQPDVVLMDVDLPRMDGIEATRRLKEINPRVQVIIITAYEEREVVARAMNAGASGFVPKTYAADELLAVIKRAAAGELVLSPAHLLGAMEILRRFREARSDATGLLCSLTPRETEVLQTVTEGRSTEEIAELLGISATTVRTHVKSVLAKLGVHSKLEAVTMGLREGFIRIPSVV